MGHATKNHPDEDFLSISNTAERFMYKRKLLAHRSFHSSLLSSIRTTLFEKSHETEAHAKRLVDYSRHLGQQLGLDEEQLNDLALLATLHDIGKISIDDHILTKPAALNENEWFEMKKHPETGYRIAMASPELSSIAELILCHHERWDGKGYPQGLKGEEIPLLSRIIAVVDAFDAITSERCYRNAVDISGALEEISQNAGTQFDPEIAELFVAINSPQMQEAEEA
jgi:HD-GYP domain-containing protein (c-di-GMP phosphodiesterase class II)